MEYQGPERRAAFPLTEEQLEAIAERAAERALEKVYASIGKSVVQKILWVVGAASLAIFAWMKGSGKL
jgi:putative NADH-flavin reductase